MGLRGLWDGGGVARDSTMNVQAVKPPRCQGRYVDRQGQTIPCPHDISFGTYCIFHASRDSGKKHAEMMRRISSLVQGWRARDADFWNFSGFVFIENIQANELARNHDENGRPVFNKAVSFHSASFTRAYFSSAVFKSTTDFRNSVFSDFASFDSAIVQDSYFNHSLFWGKASFSRTVFSGHANLDSARVRQKLSFDHIRFDKKGFISLVNIEFIEDGSMAIRDANLSRIAFGNTNLEMVRFVGHYFEKHWGIVTIGDAYKRRQTRGNWWPNPDARWDIVRQSYERYLAHFEKLGDQLRVYELSSAIHEIKRLSPPLDGHISRLLWGARSEADYKRKGLKDPWWAIPIRFVMHFLKRTCSLTALYRVVSLYSMSVVLPLLWLALTIIGFSTFYEWKITKAAFPKLGDTGFIAALNVVALNSRWFSELFRNRPGEFSDGEQVTLTLAATLQLALSATIVTLLVLAVRRRFKQ